jgi:hypothetical protein
MGQMAADYYNFVIIGKELFERDRKWPEMKGHLRRCGVSRELLVNN